jgi:lipopolysaccharide export system permease protein
MAVLKLPFLIQKLLPFITLFSAMITFWKLNKTQELLAFQNAGISIWQMLYPMGVLLVGINGLILLFFNPLGASMMNRLEKLDSLYFKENGSRVAVAKTGFWIRQLNSSLGYTVVRSDMVDLDTIKLDQATFTCLDEQDNFISRFDAKQAFLRNGYWQLEEVQCIQQGKPLYFQKSLNVPTSLTKEIVIDSTVPPYNLSLWQIPRFVSNFKNLGLSTTKYWVYWHEILARPFFCLAMMIVAACIAMRVTRRTNTFKRLGLGAAVGFLSYVFSDISLALGYSATIPIALSVWGPIGIVLLLGTTLLIHLQDG